VTKTVFVVEPYEITRSVDYLEEILEALSVIRRPLVQCRLFNLTRQKRVPGASILPTSPQSAVVSTTGNDLIKHPLSSLHLVVGPLVSVPQSPVSAEVSPKHFDL